MFLNLLTNSESNVLTITINRPDKLNALNTSVIKELHTVFKEASANTEVKAIIITGTGPKAFVAGADISEFMKYDIKQGIAMAAEGQAVFKFIENLNKPVIAAINGFALGGGLEMAMACHIRVASDNAKMGLPEVSLGIIPGYGGTQRLAQLVGKGKAFELIMTGDMIGAEEAKQWGLVNHVTSPEYLLPKCQEIANKILAKSPFSIKQAIKAINAGYETGIDGYEAEKEAFGKCFATEDFKEGTSAFLEKRKAKF